ncbi:hypothetical protein CK203_048478 [Vitis vinifera]|uniref:Retrotransposon Copia-like N-terminal domain-containing protein n=1 Tax=Vitis vinifera TaxID=29760 RepID=A0A438H265_VITVI|nr:hypothetical protein CK203_048478 [Vitis vinifera]
MSGISEDEVSEDNMKFDKPVPAQSSKGNHSLPIALYQLNGQNFLWWSQSVMHFIRRKGKKCFDLEWSSSVDSARFKKMLEKERVFEFLVGLNKELDEVRRCVLVKEPLPFTREVFLEVQREESRRTVMMGKTTKTIMVCQTSAPSVSTMEVNFLSSSYTPCSGNLKIRIAGGTLCPNARKGSIFLSKNLTLKSVLHVPNLACNFLPVNKLTTDFN